jgi:serine/threonine protein phosphatase PrpC
MPTPKISFSSFLLPKSDSALDECQDAICTPTGCVVSIQSECQLGQAGAPLRFAVADGVTTAFYSGFWAAQLVSLFGEGLLQDWDNDGPTWKQTADNKWRQYIQKRELGSISQNRLSQRDPASATFCGIEIAESTSESSGLSWRVIAVGDSCVIHLSAYYSSESDPNNIFSSHPCTKAADFSCMTSAISNYEEYPLPPEFADTAHSQFALRDGDVLLLATDALCEWMIKLSESGKPVWKTIAEANDQETFERMVENARYEADPERRLKDDDVALIVIRVGDQPASYLSNSWVYEPGPALATKITSTSTSDFSALFAGLTADTPSQAELPQQEPAITETELQEPTEAAQTPSKPTNCIKRMKRVWTSFWPRHSTDKVTSEPVPTLQTEDEYSASKHVSD